MQKHPHINLKKYGVIRNVLIIWMTAVLFAAFLFENPGARQVWMVREASFDKYRKFLSDHGNIYSHWQESVYADLAKLDKIYASFQGEKP